jgi:hypothetical protein
VIAGKGRIFKQCPKQTLIAGIKSAAKLALVSSRKQGSRRGADPVKPMQFE